MTKLAISARGDREIAISRSFNASAARIFDAFTKPAFLKRWLFGPEGWTMIVCDVDAKTGGAYRYVWRNGHGYEMGMGGIFLELKPPGRIVSTERFDQAWYPGECTGTVELVEKDGKTTMNQTLRYESREARDIVLRSPMESGLTLGYERLASLVFLPPPPR